MVIKFQPLLPDSFTQSGMEDRTKYTESFASITLIINIRKLQPISKKINSGAYEFLEAEAE